MRRAVGARRGIARSRSRAPILGWGRRRASTAARRGRAAAVAARGDRARPARASPEPPRRCGAKRRRGASRRPLRTSTAHDERSSAARDHDRCRIGAAARVSAARLGSGNWRNVSKAHAANLAVQDGRHRATLARGAAVDKRSGGGHEDTTVVGAERASERAGLHRAGRTRRQRTGRLERPNIAPRSRRRRGASRGRHATCGCTASISSTARRRCAFGANVAAASSNGSLARSKDASPSRAAQTEHDGACVVGRSTPRGFVATLERAQRAVRRRRRPARASFHPRVDGAAPRAEGLRATTGHTEVEPSRGRRERTADGRRARARRPNTGAVAATVERPCASRAPSACATAGDRLIERANATSPR